MSHPIISIIILTKNGGDLFQDSIRKIFSQEINYPFEVIIIDSGSTDGTTEFLKEFPIKLYKINPNEFSFGPTRDLGFSKSVGECLVTLSQDVVPADKSWLSNLTKPILEEGIDIVQGHNLIPKDRNVFFWEKKDLFYFTREGEQFIKQFGGFALSCTNIALRRKVWLENKFSPAAMNEDKKFQKDIHGKGYKILITKNALAYHAHTYSLSSLINRCENEGFGWKIVGEKYGLKQMFKDLIQKRWVYGALVRGILKKEITNSAEVLFLFIRPICIYKGNNFNKKIKF
jgi:glycosyltransferase involved in cell wall biosynthesis